jgi:hypothetical protein
MNLMRPIALTALFSALVGGIVSPGIEQLAAPEIEKVNYSGVFDIPAQGWNIIDFRADQDGLCFLLRSGGASAVLLTDTRGQKSLWVPLISDGLGSPTQVRTDTDNIGVMAERSVALFDKKSGALLTQRVLPGQSTSFAIARNQFLSFREAIGTLDWENAERNDSISIATAGSILDAVLELQSERQAVIAELGTGKIWVVDRTAGEAKRYQLAAPEIDGIMRTKGPGMNPLIMESVSVDDSHLWAGISPYNPSRGAIILRFRTDNGQLLNRLLCKLPVLEELKGPSNPGGEMLTSFMKTRNGELFIVSNAAHKCACYDVTRIRRNQ